jgi:diguanylate cyclase (GGDEF)-like protein/PAS domain S-box-containing protein
VTQQLHVLIVEDNPADAALMVDGLRSSGFAPEVEVVASEAAYLDRLAEAPDVILCDYRLPGFDAMRALSLLQDRAPDVPFIIVSGSIGDELAVSSIRQGASDYLLKDRLARLGQAVLQALERKGVEVDRRRLAAIVESSDDAIIGTNADGTITTWNPGAERVYGYTAKEAVGRSIMMIVPPAGLEDVTGILQRIRRGESTRHHESTHEGKDGSRIDVSITVSPVRTASGEIVGASSIARDITDRKRTEEELAFLALHDRLTGLPNRTMFEQQLEAAIARARRHGQAVAVVYLDLDNFKLVNDALGHHVGDELLREVAVRLTTVARDTDLVGRHGGDEFLIMLPDLDLEPTAGADGPLEVAEIVADRIHDLLRAPFILDGTDLYASASIGISLFPATAADATALLANVDSAMYRGKSGGPGGTVVARRRSEDAASKLSLVTELRKATEQEQWSLRYQPIVDLADDHLVGAEALLRWIRSDGSEVLPDEFLPLVQEAGLMETIGSWVVKEACRNSRAWHDQGLSILTTLNMSPVELRRRDVVQVVVDEVESAGLSPSSLVIEVTETAAMMDGDGTKGRLQSIHDYGLLVAIDDFGTGYSSLSRLKHLPAEILKIDRSFLKDVPGDGDAASVVIAIVELARTLGMTPLAEGIETQEQRRFLLDVGCELGQGWLLGRPVTSTELVASALGPQLGAATLPPAMF